MVSRSGIGIGSPEVAVQKAYAKERNKVQSKAGKSPLVGTLYDGVEFTFTAGKASKIFIGATAE